MGGRAASAAELETQEDVRGTLWGTEFGVKPVTWLEKELFMKARLEEIVIPGGWSTKGT